MNETMNLLRVVMPGIMGDFYFILLYSIPFWFFHKQIIEAFSKKEKNTPNCEKQYKMNTSISFFSFSWLAKVPLTLAGMEEGRLAPGQWSNLFLSSWIGFGCHSSTHLTSVSCPWCLAEVSCSEIFIFHSLVQASELL